MPSALQLPANLESVEFTNNIDLQRHKYDAELARLEGEKDALTIRIRDLKRMIRLCDGLLELDGKISDGTVVIE